MGDNLVPNRLSMVCKVLCGIELLRAAPEQGALERRDNRRKPHHHLARLCAQGPLG
jgi:hypothetical protein